MNFCKQTLVVCCALGALMLASALSVSAPSAQSRTRVTAAPGRCGLYRKRGVRRHD